MAKSKKNRNKKKEKPVTTRDEDEDSDEEETKNPQQDAPGKGATPNANELAATQLDSDDDDFYKRTGKVTALDEGLRKDRKRLYELQESKRRLRQEEGRSKTVDENGETPLMRKVKRLKTERQAIVNEYKDTGGSMKKNKNKKKKKRSAGIPLPKNNT